MASITPNSEKLSKALDVSHALPVDPAGEFPRNSEPDPWVFREVRYSPLTADLTDQLCALLHRSADGSLTSALVQCGQLESALLDASSSEAQVVSAWTDILAARICGDDSLPLPHIRRIAEPESLSISPPEGFSYYAVHPLDYADAVRGVSAARAAVIGIRSIGTTLSAVVAAKLRGLGIRTERISVRPKGHPYNRVTQFSETELLWIARHNADRVLFLIVDEGPGRSGSTFLSVAEALERSGVPLERILLVGSHEPDISTLCASDAARRWAQYRFVGAKRAAQSDFDNCLYVGAGYWRGHLLPEAYEWPESWTQMERSKFLSPDSSGVFKFEGLGREGDAARDRAVAIAKAGFGPSVAGMYNGFINYAIPASRPADRSIVSEMFLHRVAEYLAFRQAHFASNNQTSPQLLQSTRFNFDRCFRAKSDIFDQEATEHLLSGPCVVTDGRMQPHEWRLTPHGHFLKTDATSHGDDHFFPGACHIAWDVAGMAVEWGLPRKAVDYLACKFERLSGLNIRCKLPTFILAYSVFRLSYLQMALTSTQDSSEIHRLRTACKRYSHRIAESLIFRAEPAMESHLPSPLGILKQFSML